MIQIYSYFSELFISAGWAEITDTIIKTEIASEPIGSYSQSFDSVFLTY